MMSDIQQAKKDDVIEKKGKFRAYFFNTTYGIFQPDNFSQITEMELKIRNVLLLACYATVGWLC